MCLQAILRQNTIRLLVFIILHQSFAERSRVSAQEGLESGWTQKVEEAMLEGKNDEAIRLVNKAVAAVPDQPTVYLIRGMVYFRLGKIEESLHDFDKSIELNPASAAENWQRGISLYYLKQYEAGRKQFEIHRTVNPNDVENAFWHFLCVAKTEGVDAARKALLPCGRDSRPPLMEVLDMLKGNIEPEAVAAAIENARGGPTANRSLGSTEISISGCTSTLWETGACQRAS